MPGIPTLVRNVLPLTDHITVNHDVQLVSARRLSNTQLQVALAIQQKYVVQIVATTMACISIAASLTALYWFILMRRNFRRDLILLLILSDLFKNFCYLMFGAATFVNGEISEAGAFCQASGYMLETGLEACDLAVFFISLHMTLQIFPLPNTILGYKGLYNIRRWVYAFWFIAPNIMAALAFINNGLAYQIAGAWCWLPVRPFWYRLALAWIPRYLITITILCFAIVIYTHVRSEFRIFERGVSSSSGQTSQLRTETAVESTPRTSAPPTIESSEYPTLERVDTLAHEVEPSAEILAIRNARRHSLPVFSSPFESRAEPFRQRHGSQSATTSRRGSRQVTFDIGPAPAEGALSPRQAPIDEFVPPFMPPFSGPATDGTSSPRTTIAEEPSPSAQVDEEPVLTPNLSADQTADNPLQIRRRAIKRQVRSLFVYPVAYLLFWIIPFIMHCMNYSDYYAANPVFAVSILSSWCTSTLGLVDVLIFSWRERPWRHISGSDGTFLGSFCFWRFDRDMLYRRQAMDPIEVGEKRRSSSMPGVLANIKSWTWRRLSSVADTSQSSERRGTRRSTIEEEPEKDLERQEGIVSTDMAMAVRRPGARDWFDNISEVEPPQTNKARRPTWTQT